MKLFLYYFLHKKFFIIVMNFHKRNLVHNLSDVRRVDAIRDVEICKSTKFVALHSRKTSLNLIQELDIFFRIAMTSIHLYQ